MTNQLSHLHSHLLRLSSHISDSLNQTHYTPQESSNISTKEMLLSLLPNTTSSPQNPTESQIHSSIKDFSLACALLASAQSPTTHELLSWIPKTLSIAAESAFEEISRGYVGVFGEEKGLLIELLPKVLPLLKDSIKESSIDKGGDGDEISAASARTPVGFSVLAAYQLRWLVTQVEYPQLGKLCNLVIPCALMALDHWSPEVKGQGMISFIHLAKNVNAAELCWYEDVILDACCQNIPSTDEIWIYVVQMSVLLVTNIQQKNPRSSWFEKILNEMLSHLERQPRNKERRIAWLRFIEPLFNSVGLFLLAHLRQIFPLFFQWMHADDDETVILVLERLKTVIKLTWIRNSPYITRLVDELVALYKESALRKAREAIRSHILQMLILLQQCKGLQFESAWNKYVEDTNLSALSQSLSSSESLTTC